MNFTKVYSARPIKLWNRKTTFRPIGYNLKQFNGNET